MSKVIVDLSMSLDGYIAGPNDGPGNPLGDGGDALFEWMRVNQEAYGTKDFINPPDASREVVDEWYEGGAIISGRRTFDIAGGWGGRHPMGVPFFVLTHEPPDTDPGEGTYVTDGIESALEQARAVASEKTVAPLRRGRRSAVPPRGTPRRDAAWRPVPTHSRTMRPASQRAAHPLPASQGSRSRPW
jgi:dihydrofolate reductase